MSISLQMVRLIALCCLFTALVCVNSQTLLPLQIGSFNIQVFGQSKVSKPEVVKILVPILRRYDVVLVQEIRDATSTAINQLLAAVNNGTNEYTYVISERLGRTSSKEQYAYFYRPSKLDVIATYQFNVTLDWFERPPYTAVFRIANTSSVVALTGCHVKPGDVVNELNYMLQVYLSYANEAWYNNNILMGDFNADCSYLPASQWKNVNFTQPAFSSNFSVVVPDGAYTNVALGSNCTYDRFIMNRAEANKRVLPRGAPDAGFVYRFDAVFGLNNSDASAVSDHYPIEMTVSLVSLSNVF